ncbi:UNVERIFIED_CONTAM: hypothetical protein RMT77_007046 [Armadillidium vulgare]
MPMASSMCLAMLSHERVKKRWEKYVMETKEKAERKIEKEKDNGKVKEETDTNKKVKESAEIAIKKLLFTKEY